MSNNITLDDKVLRQITANAPEAIDTWLRGVSFEVLGDIVQSFVASPSSPGEPPGVDTGNLRAGMAQEKVGPQSYIVYAQAEYAPFLEFGTESMAKRPFFAPVFDNWQQRKLVDSARSLHLI